MNVNITWKRVQDTFKNTAIKGETTAYIMGINTIPNRFNETCNVNIVNYEMFDYYMENRLILTKSVLLNMGNALIPGKDPYLVGAQEEDFFRRSNIHLYLTRKFYPIRKNTVLLSTRVMIISHGMSKYYKEYTEPFELDIITCPAVINLGTGKLLNPIDAKILQLKIETLFYVAASKQYDTLILSALGCGGYNCPPEHVSVIFKKVIQKWDKHFKNIIFCIQNDECHEYSNFQIFKKVFNK